MKAHILLLPGILVSKWFLNIVRLTSVVDFNSTSIRELNISTMVCDVIVESKSVNGVHFGSVFLFNILLVLSVSSKTFRSLIDVFPCIHFTIISVFGMSLGILLLSL